MRKSKRGDANGVTPIFIEEVISMTKDDIKAMIKQEIAKLAEEYTKATNETTGVANVTSNAAGFDGPFGDMSRRKLKDLDYTSDEDDEDD